MAFCIFMQMQHYISMFVAYPPAINTDDKAKRFPHSYNRCIGVLHLIVLKA